MNVEIQWDFFFFFWGGGGGTIQDNYTDQNGAFGGVYYRIAAGRLLKGTILVMIQASCFKLLAIIQKSFKSLIEVRARSPGLSLVGCVEDCEDKAF